MKEVIARNDAEKQDYKEKIGQLEMENEWLKGRSNKSSKHSTCEAYVRTLKDQITSLEENKASLKRIIQSKNKVISDLQREKANPEVMKCRKDEIHEVHNDKHYSTYVKQLNIYISCPL